MSVETCRCLARSRLGHIPVSCLESKLGSTSFLGALQSVLNPVAARVVLLKKKKKDSSYHASVQNQTVISFPLREKQSLDSGHKGHRLHSMNMTSFHLCLLSEHLPWAPSTPVMLIPLMTLGPEYMFRPFPLAVPSFWKVLPP